MGYLCINILEGRISFRSKLLAIFKVRKGYVIGVSPSLQIVIHPKGHADAFLRLHDHVFARIPHQYLSWPDGGSSIEVPSGSTRKSGGEPGDGAGGPSSKEAHHLHISREAARSAERNQRHAGPVSRHHPDLTVVSFDNLRF